VGGAGERESGELASYSVASHHNSWNWQFTPWRDDMQTAKTSWPKRCRWQH